MNFAPHIQVFIVGGYVRDRLLGRECKDHDFVVVGATPAEMLDMGFQKVGADFPVFLHPVTGDEFALARTERKVGVGYNGFETEFGTDVTLEDDLARRDLTINSMARLVVGWNELGHAKLSDDIVDPFGGQEDLRDGVLCHTTAAFAEDPLRVLRVARFRARFGFDVAPGTIEMMKSLVRSGECATLTPERVWAEVEKTMTEAHPELFFDTLNSLVHGGQFFPGLDTTFFRTNGLSVDERFLSLFAKAPLELLENLKAPTAVQRRVRKLQLVARDLLLAWGHPEQLLSLLKSVDAFRNRDDLVMVATVMDDALLMRAVDAASVVTFDSLSSEQQTTLRGKEVGDALDQLRLTALESA
jgi:tRNA nucleotidyltransferase/poly(A) polymerase